VLEKHHLAEAFLCFLHGLEGSAKISPFAGNYLNIRFLLSWSSRASRQQVNSGPVDRIQDAVLNDYDANGGLRASKPRLQRIV
jgi:hypothetical protein